MLVLTTSCASIISESQYPVILSSHPVAAQIVITNKSGREIYRGKTPTTLTLPAGDGYFSAEKYSVELTKDGYAPQTVILDTQLDGWYIGNILFGGLIGFLIVDPATGAMWKLPESKTVTLAEETASVIIRGRDRELRIAFSDDVSIEATAFDLQ